eukprot:1856360-Heterocapsa_arctica.AAC.1
MAWTPSARACTRPRLSRPSARRSSKAATASQTKRWRSVRLAKGRQKNENELYEWKEELMVCEEKPRRWWARGRQR